MIVKLTRIDRCPVCHSARVLLVNEETKYLEHSSGLILEIQHFYKQCSDCKQLIKEVVSQNVPLNEPNINHIPSRFGT